MLSSGTSSESSHAEAVSKVGQKVEGSGVGRPPSAYQWADAVPRNYTPPAFTSDSLFNEVRQVAFDAGGDLLAMDTVNQRVVRFDLATDPGNGAVTGTLVPPACGKRGWQNGSYLSIALLAGVA